MGIRADHHAAGKRVVFEHYLVDDARAGPPEADPIARRGAAQKLVDLAIDVIRLCEIADRSDACLDQMIAVHGGRNRRRVLAGQHELQERHLRGCILHRHAIRARGDVARAGLEIFSLCVGKVPEKHLLRVGERAPQASTHDFEAALEAVVDAANECSGRIDRGHGSSCCKRPEKASSPAPPAGARTTGRLCGSRRGRGFRFRRGRCRAGLPVRAAAREFHPARY